MTDVEQKAAAKRFAADWAGKGYEKGHSQTFWLSLLQKVYGVAEPDKFISFEDQILLDHTSFIDGFIPSTHVLIEQKGLGRDLNKPIRQSDGSLLTPFQQAKRYAAELPYSQRPRWIVTCNFAEFNIYDMERPTGEAEVIRLADLEKEYYRLQFLVDTGDSHIQKEMEVSLKAGELVGVLYDALRRQYKDPDGAETLRSLNALCVRLVFCLYAEDAGIFGRREMFHDYLRDIPASGLRRALVELFHILDTKPEDRDKYLADDDPALAAFPYVNGGLFADETIEIPPFTEELKALLMHKASENFDWSAISPTIFGAVFESTLNPETRRSGGMHYTSIENIHKVIDPLFLDDLKAELEEIKSITSYKDLRRRLKSFQASLETLVFLDPACGSGNFLTETYISLRRLENEVLSLLNDGQMVMDITNPIAVSIGQFYGIEINDFAVTVAKTALWIAESQMMKETEAIVHASLDFLPLKSYPNIIEGNALRLDWESVVPKEKLRYIMGNPPFVGARWMNAAQKSEVLDIFGKKWSGVGDLDYVCCWYKKAADYMASTTIRTALVSTNSITQGGAVANPWKPLFESGLHIDFAHRTFRWDSEASVKAHVHCVIIGFSTATSNKPRVIYTDSRSQLAENINGYLVDAADIFIEKRQHPISDVPHIALGGQPIDDGNLTLTEEEKDELLRIEPNAEELIRPYMMGKDFIDRKPRYCLWLRGASPATLKSCPHVMERVKKVKEFRLASNRSSTLKAAESPTLFGAPFECASDYVAIPKVSSENRKYIPIDYLVL